MKKSFFPGLLLALAVLLCACVDTGKPTEGTTLPAYEEPSTEETTEATLPSEPETTAPLHSPLYLPGYSVEQIRQYFQEVVLCVEYSDGVGDASLVQKWTAPIRYRIYGTPTQEDLRVLEDLFAQLNQVQGFPGIYAAEEGELENLSLNFLDRETLNITFEDILNGEYVNGATQFWYHTDTNEIYTAKVGYCTELDQTVRSSILIEEIINTLGITDTEERTDSIVYQYSDENMELSDVDWVIFKLLYAREMGCGMDLDGCNAVIEQLYY